MVIIMRDHEVLRKAPGCLLRFLCWCLWLRDIHSNISAYISPRCPWCCRYLQQNWNWAHFFYFFVFVVVKKLERQRALDCRQSFLHCCQPCCLPIVLTSQHTHAQIHTDTMVKSLSEIRLTSSVYLTHFEEARMQIHIHTHMRTHTLKLCLSYSATQ